MKTITAMLLGAVLGAALVGRGQETPKTAPMEPPKLTTDDLRYLSKDGLVNISDLTVPSGPAWTYNKTSSIVVVANNGKMAVTIAPDGNVTYGEGFTAEPAAKIFWREIYKQYGWLCVENELKGARP